MFVLLGRSLAPHKRPLVGSTGACMSECPLSRRVVLRLELVDPKASVEPSEHSRLVSSPLVRFYDMVCTLDGMKDFDDVECALLLANGEALDVNGWSYCLSAMKQNSHSLSVIPVVLLRVKLRRFQETASSFRAYVVARGPLQPAVEVSPVAMVSFDEKRKANAKTNKAAVVLQPEAPGDQAEVQEESAQSGASRIGGVEQEPVANNCCVLF